MIIIITIINKIISNLKPILTLGLIFCLCVCAISNYSLILFKLILLAKHEAYAGCRRLYNEEDSTEPFALISMCLYFKCLYAIF